MTRHLLDIDDLSADEIQRVLDLAEAPDRPALLAGRTVGLYFEKPSLRTRHSCETAVAQLGGHPVTFRKDEVGAGSREPLGDIARVLSGYHAVLGARVFEHDIVEDLAAGASIPVVNLLSDRAQRFYVDQAEEAEYPLVDGVEPAAGLTPLAEIEGPDVELTAFGAELEQTVELLREARAQLSSSQRS